MALYADEAAEFWFKYEPILAEVLDGDHGVRTGLKLRRLLNDQWEQWASKDYFLPF